MTLPLPVAQRTHTFADEIRTKIIFKAFALGYTL